MIKVLQIIVTTLVTSFFFFSFYTPLLPTNTKNTLAAIGILCVIFELIRKKDFSVPRQLLLLLLFSCMVSLLSLVSITYNQTPDFSYTTFIRSTFIWLSGAYAVCYLIRAVHGKIDVPILVHYLTGVCLFQCVSAMLIEFVPPFQAFVDSYVWQAQDFLKDVNRLYGIGASLDVAGSRFSAVLVAIAFLLVSSSEPVSIGRTLFYTLSFTVITVIGNMISRTTLIGTSIGLAWIVLGPFILPRVKPTRSYPGKSFVIIGTMAVLAGICVVLYNTIPEVQRLLRFGFEGFFSWVETGEWQTDSTSKLESMVVWPDNLRTWIIGDGYFENSRNDPNYLGSATEDGFYMGTDIGYLRFLYYFGLAGLIWIVAFLVYSAYICADQFKPYAWIFVMALLVGLAVWVKVSTDIFLYFALFLCAAALQEPTQESKAPAEIDKLAESS